MSGTDAEGQADAGGPGDVESRGGSADVDFGGLLQEFNPFRWAIEAFRAGGMIVIATILYRRSESDW